MMKLYLKKVMTKISDPSFILIAGPAKAKYELHKLFGVKKTFSDVIEEMKMTVKMKLAEEKVCLKDRVIKLHFA